MRAIGMRRLDCTPPQAAHAAAQLRASSARNSSISFEPTSGPIDSVLTTTITIVNIQRPVSHMLTVTSTAPQQSGCAHAQPLLGVNPVQINLPQNGGSDGTARVQFHWPATLPNTPQATYWFCATPSSANETALTSVQPFTVLTNTAPLISVTTHGGRVVRGTTTQVHVTNWITDSGKEPNIYLVAPQAAAVSGSLLSLSLVTSNSAHGAYTYTWTPPDFIPPGNYTLLAQSECVNDACIVAERSDVFAILTAPASPPTATAPTIESQLKKPTTLIFALAFLLALLVITALATALARSQSRRTQAQQAPTTPRRYDTPSRHPR